MTRKRQFTKAQAVKWVIEQRGDRPLDDHISYDDVVQVIAGPFKGEVGCFDDDGSRRGSIIVYNRRWMMDGYIEPLKKHCRLATIEQEVKRRMRYENPLVDVKQ